MSITTTIHTEMRRQDRAVDDPTIIKAFLHRCKMVTLAIHDEPFPYIVPLSYGYEVNNDGLIFYFHGAAEGHKIETKTLMSVSAWPNRQQPSSKITPHAVPVRTIFLWWVVV